MASLQFQSQDKENVEGFFNTSRAKGNRQALGSSSFLQNRVKSMQNSNGPPIATPRKTLGDILNSQQTPHSVNSHTLKSVHGIKPSINTQKSSVKSKKNVSFKQGHTREKENIKKSVQIEPPVSLKIDCKQRKPECDDIEYMHPPLDVKDDRYPPQEERVSNYLSKLISWRPPCLFGIPPVSDEDEDEEEDRQRKERTDALYDLDNLAEIEPFADEPCFNEDDLKVTEFLEVDIPYIDETLPEIDDTLPSLEDSYSSPSLGVLQLNDSVL